MPHRTMPHRTMPRHPTRDSPCVSNGVPRAVLQHRRKVSLKASCAKGNGLRCGGNFLTAFSDQPLLLKPTTDSGLPTVRRAEQTFAFFKRLVLGLQEAFEPND